MNRFFYPIALVAFALAAGCQDKAIKPATPKQEKTMNAPSPAKLEKKIFAHYMGCYPLDKFHNMKEYFSKIKHDIPNYENAIGGRECNIPLQPPRDKHPIKKESDSLKDGLSSVEIEAAALDIRRAIRAGIDGFAVDVLAGRERGVRTTQALFAAAEKYDLPFAITFCLDNPYRNPGAIKLMLDNYGKSSKLARRNGKPLFLGYYSGRDAECYLKEYFDRKKTGQQTVPQGYINNTNFKGMPQLPRDTLDFPELTSQKELWTTPEGFATHAKAYRHYEKRFNTPLHLQFELSHFVRSGRYQGDKGFKQLKKAIEVLATGFDSLGAFLPTTYLTDEQIIELAAIARSKGCEWGEALNYQYDNQLWQRYHVGKISETIQKRWDMVDKTGATLLQFTTWNDYSENTQLAPALETRYTYSDLNAYFAHKWKTGKFPKFADDRIYAIYHKYPKNTENSCYPFQVARRSNLDKPIEIITILKSPAKVKLVGRNEEWDAPAGFHVHMAPCTPGKVMVEVLRDGKTVKKLDCPELITDRIYKEQVTPTCFSTEFMKNWKLDFGNTPPVGTDGWYADKDGDGLPNWFEMYWFGTYGDFSTCTVASATADPDKDGFNNLQEYLNRTNPTVSDATPIKTGFTWNLIQDLSPNLSFNPDRDKRGNDAWFYFSGEAKTKPDDLKIYPDLNRKPHGGKDWTISHVFNDYDRNLYPYGTAIKDPSIPRSRIAHRWKKGTHTVSLGPSPKHDAVLAWRSPITGTVNLKISYSPTNQKNSITLNLVDPQGKSHPLNAGTSELTDLPIKKGQMMLLIAPANKKSAGVTINELVITCNKTP